MEWLRIAATGKAARVDRTTNTIHGYTVAQLGPFKSAGRGEFDQKSLDLIEQLGNAAPNGLKSRFAHPTACDDGLGKFLGRVTNFSQQPGKVTGDLQLDPTAFETPNGNLGKYVMDLAESDPDALSSSLVLQTDKEEQLDPKGQPKKDAKGNKLPPLWRPTKLHASDIVDTGEAVDGLLSADGLPDELLRRAALLLDSTLGDVGLAEVRARCHAWLETYLAHRYGEPDLIAGLPAATAEPFLVGLKQRREKLRDLV